MTLTVQQMREHLQLYFVMGSLNCIHDPVETLASAICGGVTMFQFREKGKGSLLGESRIHYAKTLQALCKENNIPFIVNDDVSLSLALDADGVHIGQDDEDACLVRRRMGNKIVGISAHTLDEARKACEQGADYIGVGPIYPTSTKHDTFPVQGTTIIREMRAMGIEIPLVGIGGVTQDNGAEVMSAGADGIAVISEISKAGDVRKAAARLKEIAVAGGQR
ncbi:thiamine phosphate synthase [Paenibacillus sp. Marseille-Q4541]|uniref:thiamine phosphate synthase n=1 Tax=Paenibacillus sp. Marseille-Q4541 TaxID=2831522 RepID=UPI001BADDDE1|nr:thiamine phosphate synthase [Paenibacillus sp. Marseille-Q4541]